MAIPIIYFHHGNPDYLKYSLKQARHYNPDSTVYLLGDKRNNKYPFITHVLTAKYEAATAKFREIYEHRSTNSANYELNCFLRWFYIKAFCEEKGIGAFIYLDSDVLTYQNFTELVPLFKGARIANTCDDTGMPAFTYFRDYQTISHFCDYLLHCYSDPDAIAKIEAIYAPFKNDPQLMGGISDMVLFHLYFQDHPEGAIKVDLVTDEIAVDSNINRPDGYETENGIKKIYWRNNLPYGKNIGNDRLVRFATLHYQGEAKHAMRKHYTAGGYLLAKYLETKDIKGKIKRAKKSVKGLFKTTAKD
jgi:hypothetical protein